MGPKLAEIERDFFTIVTGIARNPDLAYFYCALFYPMNMPRPSQRVGYSAEINL
jgi:hypothetical protein